MCIRDSHRYLLTVKEQHPTFRLEVGNELNTGNVGTEQKIDVTVIREGGFNSEIFITALGLTDVVTNPVTSKPEGDSAKKVTLTLNATRATSEPFQIVGTTSTSEHVVRAETAAVVPNTRNTSLWFAAAEPEKPKNGTTEDDSEDSAK